MNVVLLSGSNGVRKNSLNDGIIDALAKYDKANKTKSNFYNYSLGASTSNQRLYELYKNYEIIKNCDLIILDCFLNDAEHGADMPLDYCHRDIAMFYENISKLKIKIINLFIVLARDFEHVKIAYNMHKYYSNLYNISTYDMHEDFIKYDLMRFCKATDPLHPMRAILYEIGKNIIKNYDNFKVPIEQNTKITNFKCVLAKDLANKNQIIRHKNSFFEEECIRIDKSNFISLSAFKGWYLLGIQIWNYDFKKESEISYVKVKNKTQEIIRGQWSQNAYKTFYNTFLIDENSGIFIEDEKLENQTDSQIRKAKKEGCKRVFYGDIIGIFLCDNFVLEDLKKLKKQFSKEQKELMFKVDLLPNINFIQNLLSEYSSFYENKLLALKNNDLIEEILNDLNTIRLDFHIENNINPIEVLSKQDLLIEYPKWFRRDGYYGIKITNNKKDKNYHLQIKSAINSKYELKFRGLAREDETGKKQKFLINYKNINIDDNYYGDFCVWHDEYKSFKASCKKDEVINIRFSFETYKFSYEEIKDLLKNVYLCEDKNIIDLIYSYVNTKF